MKKLLPLILAAALLLCLFACGRATALPSNTTTQPATSTNAALTTLPQPKQTPKRSTYYNSNGTPHFTMTYEYDEWGNEIRREQQLNGSTYIYTLKNTYNEKGQLVQAEMQINNGVVDTITYEYNAEGRLIRSAITDNGYGEVAGHTTYTYNEQGQLVETKWLSNDIYRSTFEYNEQGLKVRENCDNGCYYIYEH